jgi:hypothetical protein
MHADMLCGMCRCAFVMCRQLRKQKEDVLRAKLEVRQPLSAQLYDTGPAHCSLLQQSAAPTDAAAQLYVRPGTAWRGSPPVDGGVSSCRSIHAAS